jgi:heptosyltransferase-3
MSVKRGKILVVRGGAIGDFILTLPVLTALHSTFPETHLEVLGYPVVGELARAGGLIDTFRSIEAGPLSRFFARRAKLDEEWADFFESFNLIISYLYDPDDIFKMNVGRASKAQFIQGPHRPDEKLDEHATSVFLKPLEKLAIFAPDPVPKLRLPVAHSLSPGRWVAIHPGSGSERKNWPIDRWIEMLRFLQAETDYNFLLTGGEAEGTRVRQLAATIPPARLRCAERFPLAELASAFQQCHHFLGHDSGITHLAAAVGCPVTALWGPSRRTIWQPNGPQVRIIEAPGANLENLAVSPVCDFLRQVL